MKLKIIGGTYSEICLHPRWDELWGSGLRAAATTASLSANPEEVQLLTWIQTDAKSRVEAIARTFNFELNSNERDGVIEFQYDHSLSHPRLFCNARKIDQKRDFAFPKDSVLCFSLVECETSISAGALVYDPQSGKQSVSPKQCGHAADRVAIVANLTETRAMISADSNFREDLSAFDAGSTLLEQENCEVVVVKDGVRGATVITSSSTDVVPSIATQSVFPIGSGDVFSAAFTVFWALQRRNPVHSAALASRATAYYCNSRNFPRVDEVGPFSGQDELPTTRLEKAAYVYLAGPLFTLPQLWMLNETKKCLEEQGLRVFSPKDEVGFLADKNDQVRIAKADLEGLDRSDIVFAILDGLDPGTLFEIGYARRNGTPVVAFSESVPEGALTMLVGTGCEIVNDFATAVYRVGWRAAEP